MLSDFFKGLTFLKDVLSEVGIIIQAKVLPLVISLIITGGVGYYLYNSLEQNKKNITDLENKIDKIGLDNLKLKGKFFKIYETANSNKFKYDNAIKLIHEDVNRNEKTIYKMLNQINSKFDGFWIPLEIDFEEKHDVKAFRLPIQKIDRVKMSIYSDEKTQRIFRDNVVLSINNIDIKAIGHYFIDNPISISEDYFYDDRNYQKFNIQLIDKISDEDFNWIRSRKVSLLIVIKRPVVVPGRLENVPE